VATTGMEPGGAPVQFGGSTFRFVRCNHACRLPTGSLAWNRERGAGTCGRGPGFHRASGNCLHIVLRLPRELAPPGKPILNAAGAGIVGGSGQAEVAELSYQIAQQACRSRDRLQGIEGIVETDGGRRLGHELRDTLCTGTADYVRLKSALL